MYQDGYPLLVASEESLRAVQERIRGEVGLQGVEERWREGDLVMERCVSLFRLCANPTVCRLLKWL